MQSAINTTAVRPVVGVVTVLYNSNEVLEGFFKSLALVDASAIDMRLYVIDNSSTNSGSELSRDLADRFGIATQIVFNNANLGVAKGNNQGIELALGDGCTHILLSNNDVEFAAGVIEGLLSDLEASTASAVTPKIHYFDGEQRIWFIAGQFRLWTMQINHVGQGQKDTGQFDDIHTTDYAPTCFMLFKRQVFAQVGLMDEKYFVYYDDADFLWRMKIANKALDVRPAYIVRHKVSTSTGGDLTPFSVYYSNRNRIYFLRKHLSGVQRLLALAYLLATRVVQYFLLPKDAARKLLEGVRDGFKLALRAS